MQTTPLPEGMTEEAFVVSFSPNLFYVGDSISRCMIQRVRSRFGLLAEARSVALEALGAVRCRYTIQVEAEREAHGELQESYAELQRLCLTGSEARVRDAAISLAWIPTVRN